MDQSVVFFINNLGQGGAERVFVNDANALARQGYNVSFIILYGDMDKSPLAKDLEIGSSHIYFINAKNIFDYRAYVRIVKIVKQIRTRVLYATLHDATFVARVVALFLPRVRLVTREANTTEFKSVLHKISDALMNWRVHSLVAVSEEVKKSMLSYQMWYANKIAILYNGVSTPTVDSNYTHEKKIILAVGSLTPKKNYMMLFEAFAQVHASFPDTELRIVGSGVLKGALEEWVHKNSLEGAIVFLGSMNHSEVEKQYQEASIFALSSDQEGCPNVLLEAMSYGVPSVATAVGAVPEIIENGISGFTVPRRESAQFASALKELLTFEETRKLLGTNGRERVKNIFSNEVHIQKVKDILHI
ncbi:MAG: glycosyltransferase [Candidatus Zambryskibacteria bacterium]|nr:glycosyltransferase [Candidatus Zambryskibacteria bacterium]